jgi:hypothetical protein
MRSPHLALLLLALGSTASHAIEFGEPDPSPAQVSLDTTKTKGIVLSRPADSLSHGNPKISPTELAFAKDLYESGQTKQTIGREMSWGGLGVLLIGSFTNQVVLSDAGGLCLFIGIPVNGSGAGDMTKAANVLDPDIHLAAPEWTTYGTSWGLIGGGAVMAYVGVGSALNGSGSSAVPLVVTGAVLVFTGDVLQYVSWYQFSSSADRAELSRKLSPYSLSVQPDFVATRDGGVAPGMALALRF